MVYTQHSWDLGLMCGVGLITHLLVQAGRGETIPGMWPSVLLPPPPQVRVKESWSPQWP